MMAKPSRQFIEASVGVPREKADAVCDFIIEHISNGLVLEDEEDSTQIVIKFYFSPSSEQQYHRQLSEYLTGLVEMGELPKPAPKIRERRVENIEWEEEYRRSVVPVHITDDIVIRPPWSAPSESIKYDIIIEPKMAFGTGTHETTRSCLRLIREHFRISMSFLDVGCGSGILSILADKMGARMIKAVDYDIDSVDNSRENFGINNVKCPTSIVHGSLETCVHDEPYDFVCANIIHSTIIEMLPELIRLTRPGGCLLLSGLLDKDEEAVTEALRGNGLDDMNVLADNEWRSILVHKD